MIPRTIIQFWHDRDAMPKVVAAAVRHTKVLHSDYEYIFADDAFMQQHIQQHYNKATLALYEKIKIPAARSDLARLMLLYHYGGTYIDCSLRLLERLENILYEGDDIVLAKRDDEPKFQNIPEKARVSNGLISAPAASNFIYWCINRILGNLVDGDYNNRVALATGPQILNMALPRLQGQHNVRYLYFSELRGNFFQFGREPGVNNSWLITQNDGIIDKDYMQENGFRFRKLWLFNMTFFHLSFSILKLRK